MMGRITSYDQNGRMVADFDKSGYDLMWMRQGYMDDIERLMAENAKLRKEQREYQATIDSLVDECADLKAENATLGQQLADVTESMGRVESRCATLRELVRYIMHQCNDGNPRCSECIDWNDGECVALLRMRELGVEVEQ